MLARAAGAAKMNVMARSPRSSRTKPASVKPEPDPDDQIAANTPEPATPPRARKAKRTAASAPAPASTKFSLAETTLTGQVLIAMPAVADSRFAQSVIYLCAHTEEGAMGIVLNRPLAAPSFADLLAQLSVDPVPPARSINLCQGGPVDNARGFVLHTSDWTGDGSLRVDDRVALTASLDILKAIAAGGGPAKGMLALGYAGWGPGQLDAEMQQNAWLSAPADLSIVFDDDHETKWRRALASLKIDPLLLSSAAGRA
jgi:putative transcriptional regulator